MHNIIGELLGNLRVTIKLLIHTALFLPLISLAEVSYSQVPQIERAAVTVKHLIENGPYLKKVLDQAGSAKVLRTVTFVGAY